MSQQLQDFWNNKWRQEPIVYKGRALRGSKTRISVDVKNFIATNDNVLKSFVDNYGLRKATPNETAHACQKFVKQFMTYKSDDVANTCPEFWQFAFESVASRIGDCEDGAILMASLMINAGVPAWRVKVAAGMVQPEPTAPQGGHAYCIFLADRPEGLDWEIHDWCYYEDTAIPTGQKPLAKNGGQRNAYKEVWFTFNNEISWSQGPVELNNRVR
jgi:hypothetical protein